MLNLNSLQRRRERYCIIYLWKFLEGLVPNFSDPIVCSFSDRRGRSCIVSHVNPGRQGTLAFNSFRWRSIRISGMRLGFSKNYGKFVVANDPNPNNNAGSSYLR